MYIRLVPDYEKAKTVITEISSLSQQILDARLALTRSKQRHPEPRLTVSSAAAQLDSQIMKMQQSSDELQGVNAKVSAVKEDIKAKSKHLETLRGQRAEVEKIRSSKVDEVEDPRYAGLYDWCVKSLPLSVKVKTHLLAQVHCRDRSPPINPRLGNFPPGIRERAATGIQDNLGPGTTRAEGETAVCAKYAAARGRRGFRDRRGLELSCGSARSVERRPRATSGGACASPRVWQHRTLNP